MKGIDIIVKGSIGHMSAFMGQAGTLTVLGDAGEALGDSLYEPHIYIRGSVASLGADCVLKTMRDEHKAELFERLKAAGVQGQVDVSDFKRYGSARTLYHFHIDQRVELLMTNSSDIPRTPPRKSATFDDYTLGEIRRAAATGIYDIPRRRGEAQGSAFRRPAVPRRLDQPLSVGRLSGENAAPTSCWAHASPRSRSTSRSRSPSQA